MTDIADRGPRGVVRADAGYVPVRPRLSMSDFLVRLWRAKWWMAAAAVPILAFGLFVAFQMPTQYQSRSALYVTAGPDVRSAGVSGLGVQEQVRGEVQILRTRLVAERTLARFPMSRLFPELSAAQEREMRQVPSSQRGLIETIYLQKSIDAFQAAFSVKAEPKSNIIQLSVSHADAGTAVELLNAAMAVYLQRRAELFSDRPIRQVDVDRKDVEQDLLEAEDAIRAFLNTNSIRDFASERATAQSLHGVISGELSTTSARQKAVSAQLSRTRNQLSGTAAQHGLFIEDTSAVRLRELESERSEALAIYTPESLRVQAIDRQIADLRAAREAGEGPSETVRRGPNPTFQALEISANALAAEQVSLVQKSAELTRQLQAVEDKLNRFSDLESEWSALVRDRDLIEAELLTFGARDLSGDGADSLPPASASSIKITEPATIPSRTDSLKWQFVMLTVFLAVLFGLIVGAARTLSMRGFPTACALQRTTGIPVLAQVGRA